MRYKREKKMKRERKRDLLDTTSLVEGENEFLSLQS